MATIDLNGNIHRGAGTGGGQFAGHTRTAPTGTLEIDDEEDRDLSAEAEITRRREEAARWGTASVSEGARTPWGAADGVNDLGPGAVSVSTPSHGGVKLSPERNALIPPALRTSSGWYEEDCEVNIVAREFPELFQRSGRPEADVRAEADRSVRNWFPDKWEKATGEKVLPGESTVRDEQLFRESTQDAFVSTSASHAESDRSFVVLTTERRADGARAEFLVPASEYEARDRHTRFIVDPSRHAQLPPQATGAAESAPLARFHTVPSVLDRQADRTLTPAARDRISRDLSKRWQSGGGKVRSLQELIEEEGVTGRTAYVDGGGKRTYALLQKSGNATYSLQPVGVRVERGGGSGCESRCELPTTGSAGVPQNTVPVDRGKRHGVRPSIRRVLTTLTPAACRQWQGEPPGGRARLRTPTRGRSRGQATQRTLSTDAYTFAYPPAFAVARTTVPDRAWA